MEAREVIRALLNQEIAWFRTLGECPEMVEVANGDWVIIGVTAEGYCVGFGDQYGNDVEETSNRLAMKIADRYKVSLQCREVVYCKSDTCRHVSHPARGLVCQLEEVKQ